MKNTSCCLAILAMVPAAFPARARGEGIADKTPPAAPPVAFVNGKRITTRDLIDELVRQYGAEVLRKLIHRKVIDQAIKRKGITITAAEIENAVAADRIYVEYRGQGIKSGLNLEKEIRRRFNMNMDEYKRDIVRTRIFIHRMIQRGARIDKAHLRVWYAQNRQNYQLPERIQVAHILVQHTHPKTGRRRDPHQTVARLQKILARIVSGRTTLARAAARYSEDETSKRKGGVVGWLPKEIKGEFPEAAWKLRPGEVSGPVRTAIGYHLIQRLAHRPRELPKFDTLSERIREDYLNEKVRTDADLWIRELMEKAQITNRLDEGLAELRRGDPGPATDPVQKAPPKVGGFVPYD